MNVQQQKDANNLRIQLTRFKITLIFEDTLFGAGKV